MLSDTTPGNRMRQSMDQLENIHDTKFSCFTSVRQSGVTATPECPAAIQKKLKGLEKWADGSLTEFKKRKCKALHQESWLGQEIGTDILESKSAGKELGVLVGTKVNMSLHSAGKEEEKNQ